MGVLLEREVELARLAALVDRVRGRGGILLIEGPAGIGKTELLEAARQVARDRGLALVSARGAELEADFPFGVARQLFEPVLAAATARDRRALLAGAAERAQDVLAGGAVPEESKETFSALHGLYWLTLNLAAQRPLLLTVDDLQWADAQSLRFLAYLRPRLHTVPVLVVAAVRTGEAPVDAELLDQLAVGRDGVAALRPVPLGPEAVASLIADALGGEPEPAFAAACTFATGGNPFLLRALVDELVSDATAPVAASAAHVQELAPANVARSILRRLGRLEADARALAEAVAVLGGEALLRDAAALAGLEEAGAIAAADTLAAVGMLEPGRPLTFVHPLVRTAIYHELGSAARAAAHRRAAEILEANGADADAVAAHLLETEPSASREVAARLHAAALGASARGAPEVAARYLRRALAEPPPAELRPEIVRRLGIASLDSGDLEAGAQYLREAVAGLEEADDRMSAAFYLRQCLVLTARVPEAVTVLDALQTELGEEHAAVLEAGALGASLLDAREGQRVAQRAERFRTGVAAGASDDPSVLAVAAAIGVYANRPAAEMLPLALLAHEQLHAIPPSRQFATIGYLAVALTALDHFDEAIDSLTSVGVTMRRVGSLPSLVASLAFRSRALLRAGRLLEAEADARDAIEAAGLYGQTAYVPAVWAAAAEALVERGRLEEADRLAEAANLDDRPGDLWYVCLALHARAKLRLAQGHLDAALTDIEHVAARAIGPAFLCPAIVPWRSDAALIHLARSETDRARELADAEVVLAREFGAARTVGVALRVQALTLAGGEQIAGLEAAEQAIAASGCELEHAKSLYELGGALRRARRRADAREPLRRALDIATRLGADHLAERARSELRATGARVRSERLSGPESLTPSERRVADLAAAGRSNGEIAATLFLTRRTIETHLTHAYQKLDITSRDQLPTALSG